MFVFMFSGSLSSGDGGVYFSTFGPATYQVGSDHYEKNIIVDCFGEARVDEYLNQGKLDMVLVYALEAGAASPAPGGRSNAVMVSKTAFNALALPYSDGNYFLRPDRILAAFHLNCKSWPRLTSNDLALIEKERSLEMASRGKLVASIESQAQVASETRNQISFLQSDTTINSTMLGRSDTIEPSRVEKSHQSSTADSTTSMMEIEMKSTAVTSNPLSSSESSVHFQATSEEANTLQNTADQNQDDDYARRKSDNLLRMSAAFGPSSKLATTIPVKRSAENTSQNPPEESNITHI